MICIPIISPDMNSALGDIKKANKIADIIELRLDFISGFDLKKLFEAAKKPIIVTNRRKKDNSKSISSETERIDVLKKSIERGADYVDIELDADFDDLTQNNKNTKIIVSYHNFDETPSNIGEIYDKLVSTNADIIKLATTAQSLSDNLKILGLLKKNKKPVIVLCMGQLGEISRILAPLYGSYLTYASLDKGKESAPGQLTAETLINDFRIKDIKPGFKIYGVIGNPISKSIGYKTHNSLFQKHNLNNIYLRFQVDNLQDFMKNFSEVVEGISVTMPHKEKIMNYLDDIDPLAKQIGAVNTVVKKNGKLSGYNTDISGAIDAIESATSIQDKNVTILGAGGAAKAIAYGILSKKGKLTILNRTVEKATELAKKLACNHGPLSDLYKIKTDILINTTSVGMFPEIDKSPIDTKKIQNMVVFDVIYNPEKTKLLLDAEKNNCKVISGKEMYINQAAGQFELWTGIKPDKNFMRESLK